MRTSTLILAGLLSLSTACGGAGTVPTMSGREGMLSKTAIQQKCEDAAEGHLRPFVVEWDATDSRGLPVASGIYFYKLVADGVVHSRKMVLTK